MPSRAHAAFALAVSLALSLPVPARALSPEGVEAWRADLAFAADSLPRAHARFFHTLSREDYRRELDDLSARLPALEHHEVVVELARIIVRVGDGHSRVTFPFDRTAGFVTGHSTTAPPRVPGLVFRHFPVRFGLFGDSLWVIRTDEAHRALLGGRVVRLGRVTAGEAIRAVEPVVQRDNESGVRNLLPTWLVCPEVLAARGVIADLERLELEVEDAGGRRRTGTFAPADTGRAVTWIEARPADAALRWRMDRAPERAHWFEILPEQKAVYGRILLVRDQGPQTLARFADSLLTAFESSHARRLVLDLRGNDGGDGTLRLPLLLNLIRSRATTEPGALWTLIDRGTFSAAVMTAADLEKWTPAIFAGEMTGGDPNSYGDSRRTVLPRSGITVRLSTLYWQDSDPRDRRRGITPHLPVALTFDDWKNGRDPVLEAALADHAPAAASAVRHWAGTAAYKWGRYPVTLMLAEPGAANGGTIDLPAFGHRNRALLSGALADGVLRASWLADGETWRLEVVPATPADGGAPRLVGTIAFNGRLVPVVLEARDSASAGNQAGAR
jgi:hypothetical protein